MSAHFVKTARRECPQKWSNRANLMFYRVFNDVIPNTVVSQHYRSGKSADFVKRKGALGSPLIKAKKSEAPDFIGLQGTLLKIRPGNVR